MNRRLATLGGVAALAVALIALSAIAWAGKAQKSSGSAGFQGSEELRKALTVDRIGKHLERFQAIADANGGNRAAGFSGFDASADYVAKTLDRADWRVSRQAFDFDVFFQDEPTVFEQVSPTAETYVEDTDYATTEFSGSGEVTAELVAVELTLPPTEEPSSSSGCEPADFNGLGIPGKVALIQRGTCDFRVKVDNAAAAGAAAVVLFNEGQEGRTDVINGTLGGPNAAIPTVDTSFALGGGPLQRRHERRHRDRGPPEDDHPLRGPDRRERDRRDEDRRPRQRGHGRRPPGQRPGGPRNQRQRLGLRDPGRDRAPDFAPWDRAGPQAPLRLVGRRGERPGRLDRVRRRADRGGGRRHRPVPQLRHDRLAELRAVDL